MPAQGENIRYEVDGDIVIITIDRYEEVRNAVSIPVGIELYRALRRFEADDSLAVALLTGAGGVFCAGFEAGVGRHGKLADGRELKEL